MTKNLWFFESWDHFIRGWKAGKVYIDKAADVLLADSRPVDVYWDMRRFGYLRRKFERIADALE